MMNAADGQGSGTGSAAGPTPLGSGTAIKIVLSVVAVVAAVGSLFYFSAVPGLEHYKYVDEVMAGVDQYRGKRLKVHGYVVEGSIFKKRDTLDYKFKLETRAPRGPAVIDVEYRGLVPDNFKAGAEVVAKGTLATDNRLMVVKDGIDAKCPSKYEAGAPKLDPNKAPAPPKPAPSAKL
jgi:cytochrome c-type biogenesis protein CcmE